ncbi:MAG: membrane protein insertase YidC [Rhodospirillaceae bacterium]|nr:membrane protein insertase YidC [Rhodospirillaceae bacterium]
MADQKNTFLAIVLSLIVLIGWQMMFPPPPPPAPAETAVVSGDAPQAPAAVPAGGAPTVTAPQGGQVGAPVGAPVAAPVAMTPADRAAAVANGDRIEIKTAHIEGSLSLTGARFDDVTLLQYRETIDPTSPPIDLLSPVNAPKPYYAELGWLSADPALPMPGPATTWQARDGATTLTDTQPLVLAWDNGAGLRFTRTIRADKNYMFTIEQTVENTGAAAATLYPYALVSRLDTPVTQGFFILHEGLLGVFNGTLKEVDYDEIQDKQRDQVESTGGWIGITDKYWLTAVAFDPAMKVTASFNHAAAAGRDRYQTDLRGEAVTLAPGEVKSVTSFVFAGAKEVQLLDSYAETLGITNFDLAIDFGWFFFLTKPFFYALIWLRDQLGSYGLAILAFTVILRLVAYPLANKQFIAMSKMKKLQPDMQKLQEKYANDRQRLSQEMMALYKREGANPLSGCLPIFIQIPIFFALYKVLFVTIEMRHAPFYGWIKDLSAADPTSVFNLFGLLPYDVPSFLVIGAWPILMGITMWLQQKLNPAPADPIQAKVFMFLPFLFTFMLASFPSGLVIYWAWSNLLGIAQQWVIMRRMGVKA